jgi:predicted HicB family RNase H-like nuclease
MIWNLRLDANTKALWEAEAEAQEVSVSEFVRTLVTSNCSIAASHGAVQRALKAGVLERPEACEECGGEDRPLHAAHSDYSRPLDVRWLCPPCHIRDDQADPKSHTASTHHFIARFPDEIWTGIQTYAAQTGVSVNTLLVNSVQTGLESFAADGYVRIFPIHVSPTNITAPSTKEDKP